MIFFSCCFIRNKQYYRLSELEVVYLVWAYKQLYILLCLNNRCIMVFIDYNVINGIMKSMNFNIICIDCTNCYFINISIYLSVYPLDVYYIFKCFNFVFDMFLYFQVLGDNVVRIDNEVEPVFDTI